MMKIKKLIPYFYAVSLSYLTASAWTLVEDFEGYNDASEIPCAFYSDSSEAALYLLPDPQDDTNQVLHIFSGEIGVDWANTHTAVPIPKRAIVGPGQVATLYWRAYEVGTDNNWVVGMTDLDEVSSWNHYNLITKVTETSTVTIYQRRSYDAANPPYILDTGVWNHFWLVVDYDAKTYRLWLKGPRDSVPVQHVVHSDRDSTDFAFRRTPETEIDHIILTSNSESPGAPNAGDLWYLDDFYITMGTDLTIPRAQAEQK
mgnify:CR=1 FL=1